MPHTTGGDPTEWIAVSRLFLIPCLLVVAGCAANGVTAGVEVVESPSDPVPELGPSTFDQVQARLAELERSSRGAGVADDDQEDAASLVDIVSGPVLPPRPASVAVIGDSLTLSAQEEIFAALAPTGIEVVVVDGVESRRMARGSSEVPPATKAIAAVLEVTRPGLWVIALGTNDVGAQTGTEVFRDDMDELLDLVPGDIPVIWVDLWIRDHDARIVEANDAIRQQLGRRRGVGSVVDWHTLADTPGIITGDGVHLTTYGQQLFADSIVAAIDATFAD